MISDAAGGPCIFSAYKAMICRPPEGLASRKTEAHIPSPRDFLTLSVALSPKDSSRVPTTAVGSLPLPHSLCLWLRLVLFHPHRSISPSPSHFLPPFLTCVGTRVPPAKHLQGLRAYLRAAIQYTYSKAVAPYVVHELMDVPYLHGDFCSQPEPFQVNIAQNTR